MQWSDEKPGVFACRDGGKIVARVVREVKSWEWASYRGMWTHDCGKEASFEDACKAAENSLRSIQH